MTVIPAIDTPRLWSELAWHTDQLVKTNSEREPLCAKDAPAAAGLCRAKWTGAWLDFASTFRAQASRKITDTTIDIAGLLPPVCLSIGRSTDIRRRIRQHFGTNANNNRKLRRLREIAPASWACDDDIRKAAIENVRVEWAKVSSWIERSLLESYGKALERPVFDLDAEHQRDLRHGAGELGGRSSTGTAQGVAQSQDAAWACIHPAPGRRNRQGRRHAGERLPGRLLWVRPSA
jgi:hypothetical protein